MNKFIYKVQIILFFLIVLFVMSSIAQATTYYIDATNGNDSNSGTSESAPWKTIAKVNMGYFKPGDFIFFKRGTTWHEQLSVRSSGSAGNPITFGAYGSGNNPIITARDSISYWNTAGKWTNYSGSIWYMTLSYDPKRVWLSSTEYLKAKSLTGVDSTSRWYWDDPDDRLYVYATSNPASFYKDIEGAGVRSKAVTVYNADHITFQNIDLRGGGISSILIAGSDYFISENCNVGKDSGSYGIYSFKNGTEQNNYGTVRWNTIDSGFNLLYGYEISIPNDGIGLFNGTNYWNVYGNIIKDWGHSGIHVESSSSTYTANYNKIHDNIISAENISYGRGFDIAGDNEGQCQYNEIYNNYIKNTTVRNQVGGDHNSIYYNIIDTIKNCFFRTSGTAQGITLEPMFYGAGISFYNEIYSNTIYNTDEAGIKVWGYGSGVNVKNNILKNNIMLNCGKTSKDGYDNYGLVTDASSNVGSNTYQYNDIYKSGVSNIVFYRGTPKTVVGFNAKNGNNGDIISNNIQADPKLADPSTFNFKLSPDSPCIDAGINVGLTKDYTGNSVPQGAGVDMGALEYLGSIPSPPQNLHIIQTQ